MTLFHAWAVLPYWVRVDRSQNSVAGRSKSIDVFFANLNSQNEEKQRLVNYLRERKPEFVFLVEVNDSWVSEIKKVESIYPYSKAIAQEGNFGMIILSKTLLEVEAVYVDRVNLIPALFLKTKNSMGLLNLILLHAHPPIGAYGTLIRDRYLETLSRRIGDLNSPLLVCGDFNTTPWSSIFQKFLKSSDLDFGNNQRIPNTWPTASLIPSLPIGHCLSKGLDIVGYSKGPDIASDHWPLVFQVSKNSGAAAAEKNYKWYRRRHSNSHGIATGGF